MQHRDIDEVNKIESTKSGWDIFDPEVAWFIYDFFKHKLKPYDKLIFYAYYVMGFTLEEIAERCHCTLQRVHQVIKKINKSLHKTWRKKDTWRIKSDDSQPRD